MKWTKEQQEAIDIRDKNILVSAAAGSGKTAVLVERIKQLILKDQVPLDHMLIVTFSNAAASEMREKIVESITREIETLEDLDSTGKAKNTFLRNQLSMIHKANISTFHAFAMEIIRRYFYLIDVDPNFKICDEAQKTILQAEAMEQLFFDHFESDDQDFICFLKKYALTKNEDPVKEMILETHTFIQSIPDSFQWLREKADFLACSKETFLKSEAFAEMKRDILKALDLSKYYFTKAGEILESNGISSLIAKWNLDMEILENLRQGFDSLPFDEFAALLQQVKFQTFSVSKAEKEEYEEIKEKVTELREKGKGCLKKTAGQYLAKSLDDFVEELNGTHESACYLYHLVESFDEIYRLKKEKKGLIDFNDIEHFALRILSHEEAAAEYRDKFAYIFIDEYQDSNIVQETLISRINRHNNLFMVGDVKQSIYKFRLAEPELFISKYERFKENTSPWDTKLDLNQNFRSKGNVITAVNDIFHQIMKKDLSGLDYDEAAALYQGVSYQGELDYPAELHLVDDMQLDDSSIDEEIREMKKAEMEAFVAAQIIKKSRGIPFYDCKKNEIRSLTNKDMVILLRGAKGHGDIYFEALQKEGIPAYIDTSDGYFDTVEIEVFLNLLRVIDNKKQDIPLLSVLRSVIFGFTIEELILIRLWNQSGAYHMIFEEYANEGPEDLLRAKCRSTLETIAHWKKEAAFMSLEDFLWKLIRDTGYYEYAGAIPAGTQRQANLRALVDKAIQFQSAQMKGLFSFIHYIEAIKKRKVSMGQVKLLGENDDVVRIMTIHKSKGLEFPMVLVGGLGKKFNRDQATNRVSFHKDLGLGMRFIDEENACYKKTIMQTAIEQKKYKESMAEEIRILYVAFTRAMDKLVLLGSLHNLDESLQSYEGKENQDLISARSYLDMLIPALPLSKIPCIGHHRGDIQRKKETENENRIKVQELFLRTGDRGDFGWEATEAPSLREEIDRRLRYVYEHQSALNLKSKFTVTELNQLADQQGYRHKASIASLTVPKLGQKTVSFTQAEKGTILHKVMEKMDFSEMLMQVRESEEKVGQGEIPVAAFVDTLVLKEILSEEEAAVVDISKILGFLRSDIGRRASLAKNIEKEVSFNIVKQVSGETIIIQGTIDCYFEEQGQYVLLDYKSNDYTGFDTETEIQILKEKYLPQIELYKEALEKIRKVQVKESYLYLFGFSRAIKVEP